MNAENRSQHLLFERRLERLVDQRTTALIETNRHLQAEIARLRAELNGRDGNEAEPAAPRGPGGDDEALRNSELRFRSLVLATTAMVWTTDARGVLVDPQHSFAAYTGMPVREHRGLRWTSKLHRDDRRRIARAWSRAVATNAPMFEESGRLWHDASRSFRHFEARAVPIRDDRGQVLSWIGTITDVEDRVRALRALQENQTLLDAIVNHSPAVIFVKEAESGKYIHVNPPFAEVFDLPEHELLGRTDFEIMPPHVAEEVASNDLEVLMERRPRRFDENVPYPDGTVHTHLVIKFPLINEQGEAYAVCGIATDVTEQRRAEKAIRDSEEMRRSITDSSPDFIMILDLDGRIQFINRTMPTHTVEQVIGMYATDFLRPEDRTELLDCMERVRRTRTTDRCDAEYHGIPGDVHYFETRVSPVIDDGELTAYTLVATDVTERKRTEQALRLTQFSVDRLAVPIIWACEGGRICYANHAAHDLLRAEPGELLELHVREVDTSIRECDWGARFAELKDLGFVREEAAFRRRDGSVVPVALTTNYGRFGAEEFLFSCAIDITDRRRAEAEREEMIRHLEQKNADLERFTYTVSHDFKTPLITIKGFLGWLARDLKEGDLDDVDSHLQHISRAADQMQRLLEELLVLARVGLETNPRVEVRLGELAVQAIDLAIGGTTRRGTMIEVDESLPAVRVDPTRMVQVYQNLIANAARFAKQDEPPRIEIGQRRGDEETIYFVRDNGIGIDPRYHEKIFGLFQQLDPASGGTGLGLAIVQRIVLAHGGRIWVESQVGQGATFCFTLGDAV